MAQKLAIKVILILCLLILLYSPMFSQQEIWPESRCGDVVIPFPFHIKSSYNCSIDHRCKYMDDWFEIECKDNWKPFLKSIKLEVTEIDFENNTVTVMNPIYRCENSTTLIQSTVPLDLSPFLYQDTNKIIFFGCNFRSHLESKSPETAMCLSSCQSKDDTLGYKGCIGTYCCQANLPWHLSDFNISILRENVTDKAYNTNNPCDFVLIADQDWLSSMSWQDNDVGPVLEDIKDSSVVPALLQWGIPINSITYSILPTVKDCHDYSYSTVSDISLIRRFCFCSMGVSGNPYTGGGCVGDDSAERQAHKHIIIGFTTFFGLISLLIAGLLLYKIIKKVRMKKLKEKYFQQNGGTLLQQKLSSSAEFNVDIVKLFSLKDLEKATDCFNGDRVLGKGAQGTVYKGKLADGKIVAVKKQKVHGNVEDFINEVVILAQINHRNVVKLLGCCLEAKFPLLIYEFISNGTLSDLIHEKNDESPLTWCMRLRISIEVAGALFYLHSVASQPIYHRDIKSTNILLDEKYRAKIADFGISKTISNIDATHITTQVKGTFGYLDPEYYQTNQLTEKSDVYSFGVVLIELLTGQKAISPVGPDGYAKSLASYFITCMDENCLFDILHDDVLKEGDKEPIVVFANLAKRCLNLNGKDRPTMREVTLELEGIQNLRNESN